MMMLEGKFENHCHCNCIADLSLHTSSKQVPETAPNVTELIPVPHCWIQSLRFRILTPPIPRGHHTDFYLHAVGILPRNTAAELYGMHAVKC